MPTSPPIAGARATEFGIGLALTSGPLAALPAVDAAPARSVELGVLVAATLLATLVRLLLLRGWVFRPAVAGPQE